MNPAALAAALAGDEPDTTPVPTIICAQAGNVNTGACDDLAAACGTVRDAARNAWVHVDGAFGLWAAAAPSRPSSAI